MRTCTTPQDFLDQSLLLIQAHPATTRIKTLYSTTSPTLKRAHQRKYLKSKSKATTEVKKEGAEDATTKSTTEPHIATLTIKTFDPVSGAVVCFSTKKVSDVSRLIGVLGRAGRGMAGLKQVQQQQDTVMQDAPPPPSSNPQPQSSASTATAPASSSGPKSPETSTPARTATPTRTGTPSLEKQQGGGGGGGGGGKGKKKKGRK